MSDSQDRRELLRNALRAVEDMRARVAAAESAAFEPIAVVGIGCRFPGGGRGPDAFWRLLDEGVDAVTEIPEHRWSDAVYAELAPELAAAGSRPRGGFLERVDEFDAHFFGIAPREALTMDPQHRLALETSWEALEHAGIAPDRLRGSLTGVFLGITAIDYAMHLQVADEKKLDVYLATGTAHNAAAGRISYILGVHGPSMAIDTACSSSLTAIHVACQSLRLRESDIALTGGVSTAIVPEWFVSMTRWGMLAPDGRCKAFDAAADGMVRAEGCGMIVLKRLSDALADGNRILSVIRGSAVNQDGPSSGLTVPNGPAQQAVIRQALRAARVSPSQVGYVEAHGTGTTLGDPIELEAIDAVLAEGRQPADRLIVGSVKTNVGHLEAASGVTGLIKTVLALAHERIPRNLHFNTLTSAATLRHIDLVVPTTTTPWPRTAAPRFAGVSSFGLSGTNAHVILEEPPAAPPPNAPGRDMHVVTLSARSPEALSEQAARWRNHLAAHDQIEPADVAHTANVGRSAMSARASVTGRTTGELITQLDLLASGQRGPAIITSVVRPQDRSRVVMLFTGQGSQYHGMGRELSASQPVFRDTLVRCDTILRDVIGRSILDVMHGAADPALIDRTEFTQPALFALEFALAEMWRSWGVEPAAVIGHSVGEYVAACVAGVFSLEDALTLIAARGRLMQALPPGGAMAAVRAGDADVRAVLNASTEVSIAAVNGPDDVVISGTEGAVQHAIHLLEGRGVPVRRLTVSHAFHSGLMDPMLASFEHIAAKVSCQSPRLPLVSNVTGTLIGDDDRLDAKYWTTHLRGTVRFADGIRALDAAGYSCFLEVGPSAALIGMAKRTLSGQQGTFVASMRRERSAWHELAISAGALFTQGVPIDWQAYDRGFGSRIVSLPTYPFEAQRYWVPATARSRMVRGSEHGSSARPDVHPLLGHRLASPLATIQFEQRIGLDSHGFLGDHVIDGRAVFPGAAYAEIAMAAAEEVLGPGSHAVNDLTFAQPLIVRDGEAVTLQTIVAAGRDGRTSVEVLSSNPEGQWTSHATAALERSPVAVAPGPIDDARTRCTKALSGDELRSWYATRGIEYGPAFRGLESVWCGTNEAVASVRRPAVLSHADRYRLHPAITDACMQALAAAVADRDVMPAYIPLNLARVATFGAAGEPSWVHAVLRSRDAAALVGDIFIYDANDAPVAALLGLRAHATSAAPREAAAFVLQWAECDQSATPKTESPADWIVIAAAEAAADPLARLIRANGGSATIVLAGDGEPGDANRIETRCRDLARAAGARLGGIIQVSSLFDRAGDGPGFAALQHEIETLLSASRGLLQSGTAGRICVVTRGSQSTDGQHPVCPTAAPLWALAGTIAAEHPAIPVTCLDADARIDEIDFGAVWRAITAHGSESHLAIRGHAIMAARLVPEHAPKERGPAFALETRARGVLDNLFVAPLERRRPRRGEVEIAVSHAALNFRDVLNALDMFSGNAGPLGAECVGTVAETGEGVESVAAGDLVFGMVAGSLRSHVTVDANLVTRTPARIDAAAAATIPVAFLTAEYGLNQLAKMRRGDRVLIHAATGGVGLAALQLAQLAGAEVFATAGNDEKRSLLARMGIAHVFDSRTTDFADQILARTGGRGVDVVLNSLAGDFIAASVRALAVNGRFVEIGKTGIWTGEQMRAVRPDAAYYPVYLGEVDRGLVQQMLRGIVRQVEAGAIAPLPSHGYPIDEAVDAFRLMAQARHIGKVVIDCRPSQRIALRPDATYLITGGFGALGLQVARWLAARGARHLALAGRRGGGDVGTANAITELRAAGVHIQSITADVGDAADCDRMFAQLAGAPELRGIIHAAGVIDDATVEHVTPEQIARVFAPKVQGTWNLHRLTQDRSLDFFVMFSSAASIIPSGGQGAYAAANAYLDAMAHHRGTLGLPALSINWGAWGGDGMAADTSTPQRWRRAGLTPMSPADALAHLERLIAAGRRQASVLAIDWKQFSKSAAGKLPALLNTVAAARSAAGREGDNPELSLAEHLQQAPLRARSNIIQQYVKQAVRHVLGVDAAYRLEMSQGLRELGMDSLMAVELRNYLQAGTGRQLASTLAFDCPTIGAVSTHLARLLAVDETDPGASTGETAARSAVTDDLRDVSDAEAEMLLAQELER